MPTSRSISKTSPQRRDSQTRGPKPCLGKGKEGSCSTASSRRGERERLEARAAIVKAMAHPSRLLIVDELSRGPRCVSELTERIGDDISTVSRHLSVLSNAGIVGNRRSGSRIDYFLRTPCILNFFSCIEQVLDGGKD